MKRSFSGSKFTVLSDYEHNALLKVILATGIGYVALLLTSVSMAIFRQEYIDQLESNLIYPALSLQDWHVFLQKPWTLLSFFLVDHNFWSMLSNMLWLFCFGFVVQSLIGFKEIIPMYILGQLTGGVAYLTCTTLTGHAGMFVGAQAGIFTMAIGALTLSPGYTYYLGEQMAIKLWIVFVVFVLLTGVPVYSGNFSYLALMAGGALAGFIYIRILRSGYHPGKYLYGFFERIEKSMTPDEQKIRARKNIHRNAVEEEIISDEYMDALLDKINQKGMHSLSNREKEILKKLSEKD